MLKFSGHFLTLLLFLGLASFPSVWVLSFVSFGEAEGVVLGAAVQKNLSVEVEKQSGGNKVVLNFISYRDQKTVYHKVLQVQNNRDTERKFLIAKPLVYDRPPYLLDYSIFFSSDADVPAKEVILPPGGSTFVDLEIVSRSGGPETYSTRMEFWILPP